MLFAEKLQDRGGDNNRKATKLIIIGIDKRLQDSDADLKNLVAALTESEHVTLIAEEHLPSSVSVAQEVAPKESAGFRSI